MKIKENVKIDIASPSSMGVRITPKDRQPVNISHEYTMQATSAETNVLNVGAGLGLKTKVFTAFVKDNPIAAFIQAELRARNIAYEGPEVDAGGPWGYRHQFNIADSGFGVRGAKVTNDRAGEVGRTLNVKDFDLKRIFEEDGVGILHLSGLIAALSEDSCKFCVELAKAAKKSGTVISFDLNYRATFWKGREDELSKAFKEIASLADILIGNEEDFQLALGIEGPEAGGKDTGKVDSFKEMIERVKKTYPNAKVFATTLRQVVNANENLWGAIVHAEGEWFVEEPRLIPVLDRIGGGDGFAGGLLYAISKGYDKSEWIKYGWASGAMAVTLLNDYVTVNDEDVLMNIYKGNARIAR
ncbi:MAG: sugar kinase [Lachnospiraceae bacterium]|nr:sugar kinase [Lachnospiraceae bacterium]